MLSKTMHSRSLCIIRSLLPLCVGLLLISTPPVFAQSMHETPSNPADTSIVQPIASLSEQTEITQTDVISDLTMTESSLDDTRVEVSPEEVIDVAVLDIAVMDIAVLAATQTPTPPALEESSSADASALDATPRAPTPTQTPTKTPTPSPTPFFLPAPFVIAPDNGTIAHSSSYPPLGIPSFSWELVESADFYEVQVSADPGFSILLPDNKAVTTYASSYTLLKALADGEYYWRVRACGGKQKQCFDYSETRMFKKDWNNAGNALAQLLSPPQNSVRITLTEDDFSWTPVIGAAKYLFELSGDPGFGTSSIVYSAETIKPHHAPSPKKVSEQLENRIYYWRVTPVDNQGNRGLPSLNGKFELQWNLAPQLLAPAPNVDLQFLPRFQWTAVEGARSYDWELSTKSDFSENRMSAHIFNTDFTFPQNFSNDQEFYWHVRGKDYWGKSSSWSETRKFRMKWNFEAQLLTPPNDANGSGLYQPGVYLSWTPIPGAERYQVQVDESDYTQPLVDKELYNVTSASLSKGTDINVYLENVVYNWRVRGIDSKGNYTPWSDDYPFQFGNTESSPVHIFPLHYFVPDTGNMPSFRDTTVAWPLFLWNTAAKCVPLLKCDKVVTPDYYEITVASDITFQIRNFYLKTKTLAAAPTLQDPFDNLQDGQIYYWRVRAYYTNPTAGDPDIQIGSASVWQTRIDRNYPQIVTVNQITLMYPRNGFEAVGTSPVLGWQPVNGASTYKVQVARDANFTNIVDEAVAQFMNYVPWQAQLGEPEKDPELRFGRFYWRVCPQDASGTQLGNCSEVRYFHMSRDIVTGNSVDLAPPPLVDAGRITHSILETSTLSSFITYWPMQTQVAESPNCSPSNPNGNCGDYAIGDLHIMLNRTDLDLSPTPEVLPFDSLEWILAFEVAPNVTDTTEYAVYVDIDHVEGSGAPIDPKGYSILIDNRYRPEYVLYIKREGNTVTPDTIEYFSWDVTNSVWLPGSGERTTLRNIGGFASFVPALNGTLPTVIEIVVPYEKLGIADTQSVGSLAVTVLSVDRENHIMMDSVPEQTSSIDLPVFVSDMLMLLYPFDTPLSNPIVHYDMPILRWRVPYLDSIDGSQVQIARDAKFTDLVETWEYSEAVVDGRWLWLPHSYQPTQPYSDNESYYMRVRLRNERFTARETDSDRSAWSPAIRIKLTSRKTANLRITPNNPVWMTPTFSWDRVDGASGYTLQIDNDSNFASPEINEKVDGITYTPLETLPDAVYYWRVFTRKSNNVVGDPTQVLSFTLRMVTPLPLSPINDEVVIGLPTFKWNIVLTPTNTPRLSAARYKIELSNDPGFSRPILFYSESNSFTPDANVAMPAGTWYWRIGIIDSANNQGAVSPVQQFKREYPTLDLLGPGQGRKFDLAPEMAWQPIIGASYYELWIDEDPGFTSPVKILTDNSKYTPTSTFTSGEYFWKVRMVDERGVPGPFEQGSFKVGGGVVYLPIVVK